MRLQGAWAMLPTTASRLPRDLSPPKERAQQTAWLTQEPKLTGRLVSDDVEPLCHPCRQSSIQLRPIVVSRRALKPYLNKKFLLGLVPS